MPDIANALPASGWRRTDTVPGDRHDVSSGVDTMPDTEHRLPVRADIVSFVRYAVPGNGYSLPRPSDAVPAVWNALPADADGMPGSADDVSAPSDDLHVRLHELPIN
jgi:hypothetical protein